MIEVSRFKIICEKTDWVKMKKEIKIIINVFIWLNLFKNTALFYNLKISLEFYCVIICINFLTIVIVLFALIILYLPTF